MPTRTSYDAAALFAAGHSTTDTNVLSGANVSTGRRKMREQAAYGNETSSTNSEATARASARSVSAMRPV